MKKILVVLLVISISLCFLMLSIENNAYSKSYFMKAFDEYKIEEATGKNIDELGVIADSLIDYLKGKGGDEILAPHFNEKEILHMRDVQELFDYARILKYISGIIALLIMIYFSIMKEINLIGKTLFRGLFVNHIILITLGGLLATDFNKYFTIFHEIFFSNDLWLLDPNTDLMIQMLPEPFFIGMAKNIGLSFFVILSILQIVGYYYMKKGRGSWRKDSRK